MELMELLVVPIQTLGFEPNVIVGLPGTTRFFIVVQLFLSVIVT